MKKLRNSGFTLAEVLITLSIIGVVAAMTIPTLNQKIRNQELKTQFKKSYSELSQAIAMTKQELGIDNMYLYYTYYDGTSYIRTDEFVNEFYKQLKINGYKSYTSEPRNFNNTSDAFFMSIGRAKPGKSLPDGKTVDCMINAANINISVDTNGPLKKPNRAGYDIFVFQVDSKDTLQPVNKRSTRWGVHYYICNKSSTESYNGLECSYYAINDQNPEDSSKKYWDTLD